MHDSTTQQTLFPQTVLLVDDNPVNLQILSKTLSHANYRLLQAENGEQALLLARRYRPSLLLLDILMPSMDGFEVCEKLKADPYTQDIAVIFLSALDDSEAKLKGFAVGGVDYIAKPFQTDEVVARVRTHIKIHQLEQQLARRNIELEADNHQILNAISEGVIALDSDGCITRLNPAAAAITGWKESECIGEKLQRLSFFGNEGVAIDESQTLPYRSYHHGLFAQSHMETIRRKDGGFFQVAMNCTPRSGGGAVVVLRDISEWIESEEALRLAREQLEQQRQHMAHMERLNTTGEMAAGIAHEVNQPLTAIANYSRVAERLLSAEVLDKTRLAELLNKVDVQARRASDVVTQVRGYVKKPLTGRRVIDANKMLQDVIALAEVDSRASDVSVHFQSKIKMTEICVDEVQIQQVVLNLIRNAIDAMQDLDDHLKEVMVSLEQGKYGLLLKVSDRGMGISPETEANMFNPFYSTKSHGMGIGLSVCQSIIRAHGGELGFERNPDHGVTFYFTLPLLTLV